MPLIRSATAPPEVVSGSSNLISKPKEQLPPPEPTTTTPCTGTTPPSRRIPTAYLQQTTSTISDVMAATLSAALLGHVLFLKNQIPLPIMQLARLANVKTSTTTNSTTKPPPPPPPPSNHTATTKRSASKHRTDLLASFDTLSSHLCTTFTALSTALARCKRLDGVSTSSVVVSAEVLETRGGVRERGGTKRGARVYVAILVGPSVGSAKCRVVLGVDGLEVKVWGEREEIGGSGDGDEDEKEEEEEESEGGERENEEDEDEDEDDEAVEEEEEEEWNEEDDNEGEDEDNEDQNATHPPPSPSPSPSPSLSPSPLPSPTPDPPPQPQQPSHAELQRALTTAERLLSRTLALADADGYGLASDMAPTQTHILIRAPRRFSHPAWIPKQSMNRVMEGVLEAFLEESGEFGGVGFSGGKAKTSKRGPKVEGVWVKCQGAAAEGKRDNHDSGGGGNREEEGEMEEGDEMIWWCWEGRIVGFSDW
ncbi:hypothetical protein AMATHDRAFT_6465 [Amanita thiersii Skay4041]|uniref:Uncharacterized protein n=1 Tax=Amanita thiersii Skay4041 TaxID=703135 RepID=A0A2A9NCB9_9AGAR|nr:hypothetical protein AMATHDRAFT_6465 [Amanita thiersii Skay4041]